MYKTNMKRKYDNGKKLSLKDREKIVIGKVLGHKKGFGFLDVEGQKDAVYLPHTLMKRLFHGDVIKVSITKGSNGKDIIKPIEIIEKEFVEMVGRVSIEDGSVFITPDHHRFIHKYYIPTYASRHARDGDYVVFRRIESDGDVKIKLRVNYVIGDPKATGFEHRYALISNGLFKFAGMGLEIDKDVSIDLPDGYKDFRNIPFITIDSEYSQDLDDAVYAERKEKGWKLFVAISDVASHVLQDTPIDDNAKWLGQTIYMPGMSVSMLPDHIASYKCSLKSGEERLSLVLQADIDELGNVEEYKFSMGAINVNNRLSYRLVNEYIKDLSENNDISLHFSGDSKVMEIIDNLLAISKPNEVVLENIGEENFDYQIVIDYTSKKATDIKHVQMLAAQKMVESIMVIFNKSAAKLFVENSIDGIFRSHGGLNEEKREEAEWFLQMLFHKAADSLNNFDDYKEYSSQIREQKLSEHYRYVLNSFINRTKYTKEPLPHFSLGLPYYLTITSPIRKYVDLFNLRAIKRHLLGLPNEGLSEKEINEINDSVSRVKETSKFAEKLFRLQFAEDILDKDEIYSAKIINIDRNGFYVKTLAHGLIGYIYKGQLGSASSMYVYDQALGWAESLAEKYYIGKVMDICIKGVDRQSQSINMVLVNE